MKQILITILLSLILLPGYATNIDVKKAGTTHQGGARMPSGMSGVIFLTNIANFSLSISTK